MLARQTRQVLLRSTPPSNRDIDHDRGLRKAEQNPSRRAPRLSQCSEQLYSNAIQTKTIKPAEAFKSFNSFASFPDLEPGRFFNSGGPLFSRNRLGSLGLALPLCLYKLGQVLRQSPLSSSLDPRLCQ